LDGTGGIAVAHARERGGDALKAADELQRGVDVASVKDRFVDSFEPHRLESSALEDACRRFGVAERKRVRARRRWLRGITESEVDVAEPLGRRQLTGPLEHSLGNVDADDTARRRRAPRLASCLSGSAANVEHLVAGANPVGGTEMLVVSAQLEVVEVQAVRR